jgi:carbonic anhydrase/acetyltransferase-like protein (isoleucine patch superfamily)
MWEARWVDIDRSQRALDDVRAAGGFLPVHEVAAFAPEVHVLDPASVLISPGVSLLPGAVLYATTTLETRDGGSITVGAGARLGPGTVTVVATGAVVRIGDQAELGPGAVTIVANGSDVSIGRRARLTGGCLVEGPTSIGTGAQVLGAVSVRSVHLGDGGDHREPDPDDRGGVVKGVGPVHGVHVGVGEVVVGGPSSGPPVVERQRTYHPEAPRRPR